MAFTPSTQDLEVAAQALIKLRRWGVVTWSVEKFAALVRTRGRFLSEEMLVFFERCGLVDRENDAWMLSDQGQLTVERLSAADWAPLSTAVLRTGVYDNDLARLLETGSVVGGFLRCPLARLPRAAPVAGAVLAWDVRHRHGTELVVAITELNDVLAISAMEQVAELPEWVEEKQTVGWRAELYSLRRERARLGANRVLHTSRDIGDTFGYDIETTATDPSRYIEVKGSRSARPTFVITAHELAVARKHPERYELHFWGEISLGRPASDEYFALVNNGYPLVVTDVAATIEGPGWAIECQSWKITGPEGYAN